MAKSTTLTPPRAGEDMEQQERLLSAGGNANGAATLEGGLAGSYKTEHTLSIDPDIMLLGILP